MRVGFAVAREPLWRWNVVRFRSERGSRGRISALILVIIDSSSQTSAACNITYQGASIDPNG